MFIWEVKVSFQEIHPSFVYFFIRQRVNIFMELRTTWFRRGNDYPPTCSTVYPLISRIITSLAFHENREKRNLCNHQNQSLLFDCCDLYILLLVTSNYKIFREWLFPHCKHSFFNFLICYKFRWLPGLVPFLSDEYSVLECIPLVSKIRILGISCLIIEIVLGIRRAYCILCFTHISVNLRDYFMKNSVVM